MNASNNHLAMYDNNNTVRWTANSVHKVNTRYNSGCSEWLVMLILVIMGIVGISVVFYLVYDFNVLSFLGL